MKRPALTIESALIEDAVRRGKITKIGIGVRAIPLRKEEKPDLTARPTFPDGHSRATLSQLDGDWS